MRRLKPIFFALSTTAVALFGCLVGATGAQGPLQSVLGSLPAETAGLSISDPKGIPFPYRVGSATLHPGRFFNPHLNGLQDFAEIGVDCGGYSNEPCDFATLPISIQILRTYPVQEDTAWEHVEGLVNDIPFLLIRPAPGAPPADRAMIIVDPTRLGGAHGGGPIPILQFSRNTNGTRRYITAKIYDPTANHPFDSTLERTLLLAKALRASNPGFGIPTIALNGGSYGAAAAYTTTLINDHSAAPVDAIDITMVAGTGYSHGDYRAWHRLYGQFADALGLMTFLDYSDSDSELLYNNLKYWPGATLDDLDLGRHPLLTPFIGISGRVDPLVAIGPTADVLKQHFAAQGMGWILLEEFPEAGHGEGIIADQFDLTLDTADMLLSTWGPNPPTPAQVTPILIPTPYQDILTAERQVSTTPNTGGLTQVWERGVGVWNGRYGSSFAFSDSGAGQDDIVFSNLNGRCQRYRWNATTQTLELQWMSVVGQRGMSSAVADIDGDSSPEIILGTQNGLYVIDASDGSSVRRAPGAIHSVTVADIFPATAEAEIAWVDDSIDGGTLIIEGAVSGARLVTHVVGNMTQLLFEAPYLYATSVKGHLFGFGFGVIGGNNIVPIAEFSSEPFRYKPTSLVVAQTSFGRVAVVGGEQYPGVERRLLTLIDLATGRIVKQLKTPRDAHKLQDLGNDTVLASSGDRAFTVNLSSGQTTTLGQEWGPTIAGNFLGTGGRSYVHFGVEGNVILSNSALQDVATVGGMDRSTAIAGHVDLASGRREVSVLHRDARLVTYDADTGQPVATIVNFPIIKPFPRSLMRVGNDPTNPASFLPFTNRGGHVEMDALGPRFAYGHQCGHLYRAERPDPRVLHNTIIGGAWELDALRCQLTDSLGTPLQTGTDPSDYATTLGVWYSEQPSVLFLNMGDLTAADFGFDPLANVPTVVGVTPGGTLYLQTETASPIIQTTDRLGVGNVVAIDTVNSRIVTGSWLSRSTNQATLRVFDTNLNLLMETAAGYVLGVVVTDLDDDDALEYVVGTQDGYLRAYDSASLSLLWERNDGEINVGADNSFVTFPASKLGPPLLVYTAGGRLVALRGTRSAGGGKGAREGGRGVRLSRR